ncbi:transcriptional regulator [Mesorhizobium sp. L-8-10]|uniref:IclR family transcriptional regulator domain-containing protein n=1 Tax=Mesorhizobium sp. L-8-10 TaxID=2744523 RepID=UPI001936CD89|nr:IclR family transcriptional regulator C-terminal domain-containing protein [Mesorhizobium sp. L-8-10]BCH28619.1 transcriptional regulator [Mesorhizobium sp. L-8-10]
MRMLAGEAVQDAGDVEAGADRPAEFVEALAKGLAVLECFDASHAEMTLSEVARRVRLSPAAARRSLITLQALGYIGQKNKRFHLRPKVMTLGSAFYFAARIDEVLQPDLRELVRQFGDASSVGTLEGQDVIYIAHNSVQRARRAAAVVGARYPACATSLGRVLLAGLPDAALDAYIDTVRPEALTSKTITDPSELRREILAVRKAGYATTVDQLDYGITALAVPIRGPDGNTVAALNTSGYTGVVTPEMLVAERLPSLRAAASRIGHMIKRYPVLQSVMGA